MCEACEEKNQVIAALMESNEILQEEVSQVRNSNRILRSVHRALRSALESKTKQLEMAQFNDEMFKRFCEGEFDAPGAFAAEGGLPEPATTVEPLAIDSEKA